MSQPAFAETAEYYRVDAALKLDPRRRSDLGQYMTPAPIARFMASLFEDVSGDIRLLDPGAGVGSLTAAFVERISVGRDKPRSATLSAYEIEPVLTGYLRNTLDESVAQCRRAQVQASVALHEEDFILGHAWGKQSDIFNQVDSEDSGFTQVIMNPPYKKINSASAHRSALRRAGIETSNLYTAFMFLAAQRLREGGEMVAIVPRSFCNGPYFKPFREQFFAMMGLRHIHIFEKRNSAFKGDEVLQENIILYAIKGAKPSEVTITTSNGGDFQFGADGHCVAEDMTQRIVPYESVIRPHDPGRFVHIAANELEQGIVNRMAHFTATLADIGVEVSTGPVVDFRLKDDLRAQPEEGAVPLLYAAHFQKGALTWPKVMKKPNAIRVSPDSRRWLWENKGHFVVTKRFTSKEERRRIVASVYPSDLQGELIGFENHLNVFHAKQKGLPSELARGLAIYLNSSLVDRYFRQFNGHTQVNATDLRSLNYPHREVLERLGSEAGDAALSQQDIDTIIEGELYHMTDDKNPLTAQQKIDDALKILTALGMPRGQRNERSALTLLALLNLRPDGAWNALQKPLMGITPIMDFTREHYGREYAPNTRETFRRQTMHQFVEAGIALYNPDDPARPVNSPKACYQISEEAYTVILTFGADAWQGTLDTYLEGQETLAAKWAKHREMQMIPVQVADGKEIALTPGAHSELIKQIITDFAPRFAPGAEVIYVGDTGDKIGYFEKERLATFGVTVDRHGKMPDVVLYFGKKNWLLLVESVTSHGPVDAKRHNELAALFKDAKPGLVYVTAFPDRSVMGRYLGEISWETEVWCADAPSHLIHFNGERFLGPYEKERR
ncbi:MAG: BsuBI/PstI restriction endonuclease C-terminus [Rhodobacteraceae bacterium HLUCCA12]|nr:MAG: BsuBI/PstI restriction endonuclease C-terminus [Rhodobacteraceae bacterium HLUCCA12]